MTGSSILDHCEVGSDRLWTIRSTLLQNPINGLKDFPGNSNLGSVISLFSGNVLKYPVESLIASGSKGSNLN
jgi:hypothetical protein